MPTDFFPQRPDISPTIYAYELRGVLSHKGYLKVGYTERDVETRVKEQHEILVFVTVGLVNPNKMPKDAGLPKNAVLGRQYVQEQRYEPGDKPNWNAEGIESLDLRPLDEQARDPQSTNVVEGVSFMRHIPFFKNKETVNL